MKYDKQGMVNGSEIFSWIPMIGFDKDLPDKGVGNMIERMGHKPTGVSVFAFHSDIIHQYNGLENEETFPPDFCSYYASPYNEERKSRNGQILTSKYLQTVWRKRV